MTVTQEYDFIIIGGGTAGCLLASRLSSTPSAPTIALLEAGPAITNPEYRRTFERCSTIFRHASLDYGYMSTPQAGCNGRMVPQNRGKGLGGSSAVNFQVWCLGARSEFGRWEDVGEEWGFEEVLGRVRMLEKLHVEDLKEDEWGEYIKPDPKVHGYSGPIDVTIGPVEAETKTFFDAGEDLGYKRNLDPNDGNLVGFSLAPTTSHKGVRVTAASAFIEKNVPKNLDIVPNTRVVKILFEGKRAVGVQKDDGTKIFAKKEVILSAGAYDSPRLLLLSGIGPPFDLTTLSIPIIKPLPGVGKHLADHPSCVVSFQMGPGFTKRMHTTQNYDAALKELADMGTGPLLEHYSSAPHAFLKSERLYASEEFARLGEGVRGLLQRPDVPSFEIVMGSLIPPDYEFENPEDGFCTLVIAGMNSQSRGDIRLESSNPKDLPLINPNYFANEYDLISLKEGLKVALDLMKTPTMKERYIQPILAPNSNSDEDLIDYIRNTAAGLWHPSCSLHMGRSEEDGSCVDKDLKVHGLERLRVVDLSVAPSLPSGHPQILAYVIGQIASEKIVKEYGL